MSQERRLLIGCILKLQHHIVNSLGWSKFYVRIQEAAISPILDGKHCILLGPNGWRKDRSRDLSGAFACFRRIGGLSVLLRLSDPRFAEQSGAAPPLYLLLGRRVGIWHGDISESVKKKEAMIRLTCWLTTPESLEGMLISANEDKRGLLVGVQLIIIDEMHAFCGDDRGWHVRCLIGRLNQLLERRLQVIRPDGNRESLMILLT